MRGEGIKPEELSKVVVNYRGSLFTAYFDKTKRLYFCPLCGYGEDKAMFFTLEDLIAHMRTHIRRRMGVPRDIAHARKGEGTEEQERGS